MSYFSSLDRWDEAKAAQDDAAKHVEPVALGASLAFDEAPDDAGLAVLQQLVLKHCNRATEFYSAPARPGEDYRFDGDLLTFQSAIATETPNSDLVRARVMESKRQRSAVIILPHWSAPTWGYQNLAGYFARLGLTAVEFAPPYHGLRMREGSLISDHFLSPNLGRTIRSVRQAVIDTSDVVTWLKQRGHDRVAVIGFSLGSCIAGLAGAFDQRIRCTALLLTAGDFADVVWSGRATQHIRRAVEPAMTLDELKSVWSIISTGTFARQLGRSGHDTLIFSGTRDTVVKPHLTREFIERLKRCDVDYRWMRLPCGHYSLARAPFNVLMFVRLLYFLFRCGLFKRA